MRRTKHATSYTLQGVPWDGDSDVEHEPQYERPIECQLWLPEPQWPEDLPEPPGRAPGKKLWFEGPSKLKKEAEPEAEEEDSEYLEHLARKAAISRPSGSIVLPRDVRRGDKWLPWHESRTYTKTTQHLDIPNDKPLDHSRASCPPQVQANQGEISGGPDRYYTRGWNGPRE